jgi:hypothetical protein
MTISLDTLNTNPDGSVSTSTFIVITCGNQVSGNSGVAATTVVPFVDGLDLHGSMQFGVSQLMNGTTMVLDISIIGYEY